MSTCCELVLKCVFLTMRYCDKICEFFLLKSAVISLYCVALFFTPHGVNICRVLMRLLTQSPVHFCFYNRYSFVFHVALSPTFYLRPQMSTTRGFFCHPSTIIILQISRFPFSRIRSSRDKFLLLLSSSRTTANTFMCDSLYQSSYNEFYDNSFEMVQTSN